MKHGSLFSGIGGFDLAAEWMGWDNVFHCEWNEFGQKVLKHYWPKAISYDDITKTDFTIHRGNIDILTGGFPCQPYSNAGKRKGTADDRHLWPEMLRAIREIQPTFIVGENVRGLTNWNGGLVFDQVQADMEAEGYQVLPFLLPACAVNAPHRRDRIWFVAHADSDGHQSGRFGENRPEESQSKSEADQRERLRSNAGGISEQSNAPNASNIGHESPGQTRERRAGFKDGNSGIVASDTNSIERSEGRLHPTGSIEAERYVSSCNAPRFRRNTWKNFPTQSPICNGDDGLSSRLDGITFPKWRNESIKGGGNAIVPQIAYELFKVIGKMNDIL